MRDRSHQKRRLAEARIGEAASGRRAASNPTPSRAIAFEILNRVYNNDAYASAVLASFSRSRLSPEDRALAHEITLGVLRWQAALDYLIELYSGRTVGEIDLPVLIALRIGIYQLRWLTRIPPRAAVGESVNLVKRSRSKSAAGLTNAVMRKAANSLEDQPGANLRDPIARLSVELSHPRWIIGRWLEQLGETKTRSLALANNHIAPLAFRVNTLRATTEEVIARIEAAGHSVKRSALADDGFRIDGRATQGLMRLAEDGLIYFQDEASQLVSLLVGAREGELILDMCAAPGSKSSHIAVLTGDLATIIACDLHTHRLATLADTCSRLEIRNVIPLACDATRGLPLLERARFDRILLDAPCSGTGTLRHNPEIKWRLKPEDITRLAGVQLSLLRTAASVLRANGLLVYSTCSIEREEDEGVIKAFLKEDSRFQRVSPTGAPRGTIAPEGFVRTFPDQQGTDGFFVAILRKG